MFFDRESHSPLRCARGDELSRLFDLVDRVSGRRAMIVGHHREIVLAIAKGIDIIGAIPSFSARMATVFALETPRATISKKNAEVA